MQKIDTSEAPAAIGPYSQAVCANGFVHVSGQLPLDPETGSLVEGSIAEQTRRIIFNIEAILRCADCKLEDVVMSTCYVTDLACFQEFNEEYARHFVGSPARACVQVAALPKGASLEISVIAACR